MRNRAVLTSLFLVLCLSICLSANGFTLVIDAGHGGHDTGAKGAVSLEKDINLKVALAFGQYVEQNCSDVKVIYTRKTDVFIPLKERANIANRNNADLFISVHTNALPNGRIARGFEVYTLGMHRAKDNLDVAMRENSVIEEEDNYKQTYQGFDPKSSESYIMFEFMQSAFMRRSVELAKLIETSVCNEADRVNMGVHQAGFLVLRETSMPSCLIELGFITTEDEEQFLNTDDGVNRMAYGIYKAFLQYKDKYHGKPNIGSKAVVRAADSAPDKGADSVVAAKNVAAKDTLRAAKTDGPVIGKKAAKVAVVMNSDDRMAKVAAKNRKTEPAKQKVAVADKKSVAVVDKPSVCEIKAKPEVISKKEVKPAVVKQPKPVAASVKEDNKKVADANGAPVFKVQIFAVGRKMQSTDPMFKGHKDVGSYSDAGSHLIKYTIGSATDFNAIIALRDSLKSDFPQAYIVAFKDGKPYDLSLAIKEFKKSKSKQRKK
ncbi:MAG: N-acetylmuramoyl-L-alanine amidase [Prevotella sp.]|uniref:N-acetylmuramoyl-L-alanine amidase n=1 Tax=Prevotella sp. TaxID=59823 RepID=UPI00258E23C4|nr:N-acetylmuramoyl-L-alanine amidase [Prevotella sp.]MDD6854473.1 N-acetylmuramoyl-L-alanine amidase [Prevotella sp.]